ncbi:MAG: IPTL-CTERM sorting domain-containing protein, partial [Deltaproteobacteria bacterium]|nr:IPTL-CTERM sorting domain-containing protein [Deltaproteobacteria bacterium]
PTDTPTPTPTATNTPTATPTPTATNTPLPTATPTATSTNTPTPTASPTPTNTPTSTPIPPTPTPTPTPGPNYYTLTVVNTPANAGSISGSDIDCPGVCTRQCACHTSVTLTASGRAGYVFSHWETPTGGTSGSTPTRITSTSNQLTLVMDSDQTVTAVYIADPSIPTLNEWGMIIFVLLAVTAGYYLRRRQRREV